MLHVIGIKNCDTIKKTKRWLTENEVEFEFIDLKKEPLTIDEIKELLDKGYNDSLTSMQGLGYKEIVKYLKGEYTFEEAIDTLKRDSRRFAKRQLTWFRRDKRIKWINVDEYLSKEDIVKEIVSYAKLSFSLI